MTRVSIIMATYNCLKTIPKTMETLQGQTFTDLEILIVDDQSTDGTWEYLQKKSPQDSRIRLFRTSENSGSSTARQIALDHATGEWMTLCDGDDWYEYDRIEQLLKIAKAQLADAIIDNLRVFDHAVDRIVKNTNFSNSHNITRLTPDNLFKFDHILQRDSVGYSQPLVRMQFLQKHRIKYWRKYRNNEDFLFLSDIILSGARAFITPGAYYVYRHRISPTTKQISPTSHSANDTTIYIAQASDELIEKYQVVLSARVKKSITRRKNIFLTAKIAGEQTSLIIQGHYGKAVDLFFKYPFLWRYRALGVHNRLSKLLIKETRSA